MANDKFRKMKLRPKGKPHPAGEWGPPRRKAKRGGKDRRAQDPEA